MLKKTKVVCTIGPASESEEMLEKLMLAGMNVARLNFSHGTHPEHQVRIDRIRKVADKLGLSIAIMLDTKGPEIRLGDFKDGQIEVEIGDTFTLTTRDILGDKTIVSVSHQGLASDVKVGDLILIDDGLIELEVREIKDGTDIICRVNNSGQMSNHKGVNVPNVKISLPAITEKDREDILFGIENQVDFLAASFVRKKEDVFEIRRILEDNHGEYIQIIPKIENQEGIDNIDEILLASDGLMVARGDLGVEVPPQEIPLVQKMLIKKCYLAGKPVITATQMLDSMIRNPRPTRAEVTDVANAIIDGTSAIMLSGETAAGKYPEEAVKMMTSIARRVEESLDYDLMLNESVSLLENTTTNSISKSACVVARDLEAAAIVAATTSGATARALSKYRPKTKILAVTPSEKTVRKMALSWGVEPLLIPDFTSTDDLVNESLDLLVQAGMLEEGDLTVVTAGVPVGLSGSTNLLKVKTIATLILSGLGLGKRSGVGKVVVANTEEELLAKFKQGDIIVCQSTDKDMVKFIEDASALIVEEGGYTSHAAIVGLHLNIPTIIGAKGATTTLKDGDIVTVDTEAGSVYKGRAKVK
ncbi:pyruvate kinase [Neofamilia massiliensis]|uniref:pyruvate kinase n=1 Tax=Neofamilia massiliensis TaxID=1673724 RepID=UPI0006BB74EC|nr:pyruvate kinase [Neofamilia massiliensis]